ncbi:hypothetical protein GCM10017044_28510 [Kordiimonas sediminis]|uniref:Translocation and assembly module TamB C-terminal domain-containing protein n=1 Tax=Kordiimonas sediminis TaxID=1735581 RepID=A0A919EAW5_9PROT|nr:translocation/assembly module TamB domain-containing protein [Kordiimonas sediminis]GHF31303.1 hypothetical protein GCM10017044_28510 [Kordiimonas sediminis]
MSNPEHIKSKITVRVLKFAAGMIISMVALLIAAFVWIDSNAGHAWLAHQISVQSDQRGLDVTVESISGSVFDTVALKNLTVRDKEGQWLDAKRLDVSWRPIKLVSGRVALTSITVSEFTMTRLPHLDAVEPNTTDQSGHFLSDIAVQLDRLDVDATILDQSVAIVGDNLYLGNDKVGGTLAVATQEQGDTLTVTVADENGAFVVDTNVTARPDGLITGLLQTSVVRPVTLKLLTTLNPDPNDILSSAQYSLAVEEITLPDLSIAGFTAEGTTSIGDSTLNGSAAIIIGSVQAGAENFDRIKAQTRFTLQKSDWHIYVDQLDADILTASNLALTGSDTTVQSAQGTLDVAGILSRYAGDSQPVVSATSLPIQVHAAKNAPSDGYDFTVKGQAEGLQIDQAGLAAIIGHSPVVDISGRFNACCSLVINSSILKAQKATLTLHGETSLDKGNLLVDSQIKGAAQLSLAADALQSLQGAQLSSALILDADLSGTFGAPEVYFQSQPISVSGYGIDLTNTAVALRLRPGTGDTRAAGEIALGGASRWGDFMLESPVRFANGRIGVPAVKITTPIATGTGRASWTDTDGIQSTLDLALTPLENDFVQVKGSGSLSASVDQTPDKSISLKAEVIGNDITLTRAGGFPIKLDSLNGTAHWNGQDLTTDVTLNALTYGAKSLSHVTIQGNTAQSAPFKASAKGIWAHDFAVEVQFAPDDQGGILKGFGSFAGEPFEIRDPITIALQSGIEISAPNFTFSTGTVSADLSWANEKLRTAHMEVKDLPMSTAYLLGLAHIEKGTLDATLVLANTETDTLTGSLNLGLRGIEFPVTNPLFVRPSVSGELQANLNADGLTISGNILTDDTPAGSLDAHIPLSLSPSLTAYKISPDIPLRTDFKWDGAIAPLWSFVAVPGHTVFGQLQGALTVSGPLNALKYDASLSLEEGHYEYTPLNLVVAIEALTLTGSENAIALRELKATDGEGGLMTGQGEFSLHKGIALPGHLRLTLQDFHLARLETIDGFADADITYSRNAAGNALDGSITVNRATFQMPKQLPVSVVDLEVEEINLPISKSASDTDIFNAFDKKRQTTLDLAITIPRRLYLNGRGLQSEWRGALSLGGTTNDPRLLGQLSLEQGQFAFGSKSFDLTEGRVTFAGQKGFDPSLLLSAKYQDRNIMANLSIAGQASAPRYTLSSSPSLPEDEIVARVLLGRSVSELSALQLAELASALNGLRGGGFDGLGKVRRLIGLDTFSISDSQTGDGHALITGGKYLHDNVYLEVETTPASSETATRLKINLTKRLLLQTEMGPRQDNSLYLKWFWDY